ncbi:hypothetical protein [Ferrovibrio sp.]|jgi:hypothetical protein|uniref:hypothetical protein n=1 Tax=Ferrovibrio sp. TaxID=1917215 RepID=UPI0025C48B54|nr:hypothetical protein [Ferrovibrio sp.]
MILKRTQITLSPWRHFAATLALFALLFAGTVSSLSHSMAMAATSSAMIAGPGAAGLATHDHVDQFSAAGHEHQSVKTAKVDAATAHEKGLPHDHDAIATGGDSAPGNCDQGCILCKDCALCGLFAFGERPLTVFVAYYAGYELPVTRSPASLTPALPSEPPRV